MVKGASADVLDTALETLRNIAQIIVILLVFQVLVLRKRVPNVRRVVVGFGFVVVGLTLFVVGLEEALFPLGRAMAEQLTDPEFILGSPTPGDDAIAWWQYYWVYAYAASIGFAAAIAEPALIAVSLKASDVSGGAIRPTALRIAVAIGAGAGVAVGALRIVTDAPLYIIVAVGYAVVIVQTGFARKTIVPLAYDSGGATTSTVTVPIVTALGLGLASIVPGRSELVDGFGMIALAALFPIIAVLAHAQLSDRRSQSRGRHRGDPGSAP